MASSTDNFAVGLSTGLARKRLSARTDGIISICNASGAYFASSVVGTSYVTSATTTVSGTSHGWVLSVLASLAFFYLAYKEGHDTNKSTTTQTHHDTETACTNTSVSPLMAIPMTLNNLVGGVAGGAVGISPMVAATCALFASYLTMTLGHWMGLRASSTVTAAARYPPSKLASFIYVILGLVSLWAAVTR